MVPPDQAAFQVSLGPSPQDRRQETDGAERVAVDLQPQLAARRAVELFEGDPGEPPLRGPSQVLDAGMRQVEVGEAHHSDGSASEMAGT